ncbi:aldo/keto reductase [Colletotrichum tofieldiae]|nr:aldo/keto reductase [Colletotrichum tofieldiae]
MATIRDRRTLLSNELKLSMQVIDGDIVQAIQALKETKPDPEEALEIVLQGLVKELEHYNRVHDSREPDDLEHPFKRGERQVIDAFAALFPNIAAAPAISRTKSLMSLNINTQPEFETFALGPYQFPRLLNGLWQLSSPAWGCGSNRKQEEELIRLVQSGFTAADMADHYGDAELVYAHFRNRLSPSVRSQVLAATKWCVFAHPAEPLTSALVFEKVKERYRRLGGRVELLQFHWHDITSTLWSN